MKAGLQLCVFLTLATGSRIAHGQQTHGAPTSEGAAVHEAMAGTMHAGRHLQLTPVRRPSAADSMRAGAIVDSLRRAISGFADTSAATAAGYRMFLPNMKNQRVYHFTHWGRAIGEAFRFNAAKPTSLIYRRADDGRLVLIGAMYGAPRRLGVEDLDARVPLSIARWHKHVNLCLPRKGEERRWNERGEDGAPLFGSEGSIATADACDAAGGRYFPTLFGWMVHVNAMEKNAWAEHSH